MFINTTLGTSNEILVALVKTKKIKSRTWRRNFPTIRSQAKQEQGTPQPYALTIKKEGYHQPQDCYGFAKHKDKIPPGWRITL